MTSPAPIPPDILTSARDTYAQLNARKGMDAVDIIARALLAERLALLKDIREPGSAVVEAMALTRAEGLRLNGHGEHAYRDAWMAGVDALIRSGA